LETAVREGAGEIAIPTLVSTLSICIVFVPMFFLTGVARYLFVPLAEAVMFAMLASYLLSRTLIPTLVMLFMRNHAQPAPDARPGLLQRVYRSFDARFEQMRGGYVNLLSVLLPRRRVFAPLFLGFCVLSTGLYTQLGRDFFPSVDAGQIRLHFRMPTGTRIEETARHADLINAAIREIIPAEELGTLLDNLGLPYSGINLSYSNAGTIGTLDGETLIALKPGHAPSEKYVNLLRRELPQRFPGIEFFFQPADVVTQILNFGLPAAIDVQFSGSNVRENHALAAELQRKVQKIPGAVDVHIHQRIDQPVMRFNIERSQLQQMGLSAANVARNMLVPLSGSFQTAPTFWLDPKNGVSYQLTVQTPQSRFDSLDALMQIPVGSGNPAVPTQLLGNLVQVESAREQAVVSRYNISPVIDLYVSVSGRDLGSVAAEVEKAIEELRPSLPKGSSIAMRGQVQTMKTSFVGLGIGLAGAIVLVYLLI